MDILRNVFHEEDWPDEAEDMYERIEVLGRGSFGLVWMGKRRTAPLDELDDEYVALKNIEIKEEKGKVYAQREISILAELRHPNVILLIRAFPIYKDTARLVALQLARGPNLQRVVSKRGAVGLPLARLVCRQLIAAVSYLHGRAVLHRDIKPTNCILENTELPPNEYYDYTMDSSIWSDGEEADEAVARNKWKVMLVDFGFARALEEKEYKSQQRPMRNSIILEKTAIEGVDTASNDSDMDDLKEIERAAAAMRRESIREDDAAFVAIGEETAIKKRVSHISVLQDLDETEREDDDKPTAVSPPESNGAPTKRRSSTFKRNGTKRQSTTRTKMRSMSALGTKAYAAPEIKNQLRNKTTADSEIKNAALTECVADYGMIVDAYSVGWTLRVVLTGVPPNATISQFMRKHHGRQLEEDIEVADCCCFGGGSRKPKEPRLPFRVRDIDEIPKAATLFISALTKSSPEERMTVREAQNHVWIRGSDKETQYKVRQGDYPSHHGDPVVPLACAGELSRIVEAHHL
jgi:serine/threonine protein kinase